MPIVSVSTVRTYLVSSDLKKSSLIVLLLRTMNTTAIAIAIIATATAAQMQMIRFLLSFFFLALLAIKISFYGLILA